MSHLTDCPGAQPLNNASPIDSVMTSRFDARYSKEFLAGWGAMDFNGHLANTAYLDLAADVRMAFFADHGFPLGEFRRLAIGPARCAARGHAAGPARARLRGVARC